MTNDEEIKSTIGIRRLQTGLGRSMNDIGTSYLFWLGGFFGLAGLHRLYNKKLVSGFLWLFTWGFFGIGQLIDLLLIPRMVEEHNQEFSTPPGWLHSPVSSSQHKIPLETTVMVRSPLSDETVSRTQESPTRVTPPLTRWRRRDRLTVELLKAAQNRGGQLCVTQGVLDTGASFAEVEAALHDMVKSGYVCASNHPVSGVVIYDFIEL